jgi:hypothetical protein
VLYVGDSITVAGLAQPSRSQLFGTHIQRSQSGVFFARELPLPGPPPVVVQAWCRKCETAGQQRWRRLRRCGMVQNCNGSTLWRVLLSRAMVWWEQAASVPMPAVPEAQAVANGGPGHRAASSARPPLAAANGSAGMRAPGTQTPDAHALGHACSLEPGQIPTDLGLQPSDRLESGQIVEGL